jgi:polyisoprenyl-phosphate glycosyltransferase
MDRRALGTIGVLMTANKVLIIVPVFNEARNLQLLIKQLDAVLRDRLSDTSLLIVDDGSLPLAHPDPAAALSGQMIRLKRNVGHQRAIALGLAYAVENRLADVVVVMDADGEDKPDDVPRLLLQVEGDASLVAVGHRTKRSEDLTFRTFYQLYRLVFLILTGRRIDFGNFVAMSLDAARRLANMSELWLSLPATLLRSHLPLHLVSTERGRRYYGTSHMNFVSLVIHGLSAVAVFVDRVLTRIILAALALLALCFVASAVAIILKLFGAATPGWLTSVVGISLLILLGTVILCFVSLAISITGGIQAVAPPLAAFQVQIERVTPFGGLAASRPDRRDAIPAQ